MLICLCLGACNGQEPSKTNATAEPSIPPQTNSNTKEIPDGIMYLSYDNGSTWESAHSGLPQHISIGLGGVAVSETMLGVATKTQGVYLFQPSDSTWTAVPTTQEMTEANTGALAIFNHTIYVGTQHKGVFYSKDLGKTWALQNNGLQSSTIRRFITVEHTLYACTNDGFYALDEKLHKWQLEYGQPSLQVNGATFFKEHFYIATNKGLYKKQKDRSWVNLLPEHSVHNIGSDADELFAMTYTEYLLSSADGINWSSIQDGLPEKLYTFNVVHQNNTLFAGQWDGVYSKQKWSNTWTLSNTGMPQNAAVTNLKSFNGILVATLAQGKLSGEK